ETGLAGGGRRGVDNELEFLRQCLRWCGTIGDSDCSTIDQIAHSGSIQADGGSFRSGVLGRIDGVARRGVVVEHGRLPQPQTAKSKDAGNQSVVTATPPSGVSTT